jgi:uncharacterized protein YciI
MILLQGAARYGLPMLYAVLFTDDDAHADARRRLMPAHLDFLERHRDRIRAAGPLREANGTPAGGLWLVEADTPEAVAALYQEDPFWPTGLRKSVRVLQWSQVFAEGRRLMG